MAILDIESLLAPISDDRPAGPRTPDHIKEAWKEARTEINPEDYAEDDPARPTEAKKADWPAIVRLCIDCLKNTSKDLVVAAWLTEALTKVHGLAGLAEGLTLMRRLLEEAWDRIHPEIESEAEDLEYRAGPFNWLDDSESGARFPVTLNRLPVIGGIEDGYSLLDWNNQKNDASLRERIARAKERMTVEQCQTLSQGVADAIQALIDLGNVLNQRFGPLGSAAPSFSQVRRAVLDIKNLADGLLKEKGGAQSGGAVGGGEAQAGAGVGAAVGGGGGGVIDLSNTAVAREQIYNELERFAGMLKTIEPHSPVPYLIERAVALGRKPFPEMIKSFVRDDSIIQELFRELDISSESSS
jgi:type VI secretion system protein ImpA